MSSTTPNLAACDVRLVPEWEPQRAIWTAWPADPQEWDGDLESPRRDVVALIDALSPTNHVRLLVNGKEAEESAGLAVGDHADIVPAAYGDIWLRDTGPIFAESPSGPRALLFRNNGWGGKFQLAGDERVGAHIAELSAHAPSEHRFVLEGGAIDHDGQGTILTTRQTLLNPNRNGWSQADAEEALRQTLGAKNVLWLDEGIIGDHTDGHVDNLARFTGPQSIVCQEPAGPDDPNRAVFEKTLRVLHDIRGAKGTPLNIVTIPSPGPVQNRLGEIAPASYLNFVIANGVVVVPVFGTKTETEALKRLQELFPDRQVVGLEAFGLLGAGDAGGGAFHCITREEPHFPGTRLPSP